jgi:glycosyltransferase involved in cell wall biosynthesis
MEAMSLECAIVASNTAPVQEVIQHELNGLLVDFFNPEEMVRAICRLLENPTLAKELGKAARAKIVSQYDLNTHCLPMQMAWVKKLAGIEKS